MRVIINQAVYTSDNYGNITKYRVKRVSGKYIILMNYHKKQEEAIHKELWLEGVYQRTPEAAIERVLSRLDESYERYLFGVSKWVKEHRRITRELKKTIRDREYENYKKNSE